MVAQVSAPRVDGLLLSLFLLYNFRTLERYIGTQAYLQYVCWSSILGLGSRLVLDTVLGVDIGECLLSN